MLVNSNMNKTYDTDDIENIINDLTMGTDANFTFKELIDRFTNEIENI